MPGPITWMVTNQSETTDLNAAGQAAKGTRVTFQLSSGEYGTVFLPEAQYTPDAVAAAISAKVANMVAIKGLTG